ncbi:MAG: sugar phosphate isomerase/epimerase [Clostridia bacterium]|nr:sugar phosphate isomerase/epimerase [Clostridia bacterium]
MDLTKIAAQMYTLREFTRTPEDIASTLKKVKEIGYDAIQISGFCPCDPAYIKELLDENGLFVCATHMPFRRLVQETDNVIAEHKLWNCPYIGIGSMPDEFRASKEAVLKFVEIMKPIADKIYDEGMKFVYHNHRFEFTKDNGKTFFEYMADAVNPEKFGFLADTYWIQAGGANPAKFIRDYANYIDVVHLKDMQIINDKETMAEVGEGNMDWESIIGECEKADVKWYAVEQDICYRNQFESMKISLENLKRMKL